MRCASPRRAPRLALTFCGAQVTVNIQSEVEGHLRLLDQMGLDMDHTRGAVGGTMERFKRVLEHKGNRSLLYAGGAVFTLFAVFKLIL